MTSITEADYAELERRVFAWWARKRGETLGVDGEIPFSKIVGKEGKLIIDDPTIIYGLDVETPSLNETTWPAWYLDELKKVPDAEAWRRYYCVEPKPPEDEFNNRQGRRKADAKYRRKHDRRRKPDNRPHAGFLKERW